MSSPDRSAGEPMDDVPVEGAPVEGAPVEGAPVQDVRPEGSPVASLRQGPLRERHEALGARFSGFGGYEMPLQYAGVVQEHTAVRSAVGLFDVSHLGKGRVAGPGARAFVDATLTNDLSRIGPGQAQYTLCCDEATGGTVDDLITYLRADDDVLLVPNAANTAEVLRRLAEQAPAGLTVDNEHERYAVLAVQGPRAPQVMGALDLPTAGDYMSFTETTWRGLPVVVCRSGYTGELGYELMPRWQDAGAFWDALLEAARPLGGQPCGLGARDTLRTEMGYPLHGQDLSWAVTPVQARLGWAVGWDKPRFWGREALVAEREHGPARLLRGLLAGARAIPRPHMVVSDAGGRPVGEVTSGTFSPTRRVGIGLALLDRGVVEGDEVLVDVRGRPAPMTVVRPPFVDVHTR